jgi:hypothetical protein
MTAILWLRTIEWMRGPNNLNSGNERMPQSPAPCARPRPRVGRGDTRGRSLARHFRLAANRTTPPTCARRAYAVRYETQAGPVFPQSSRPGSHAQTSVARALLAFGKSHPGYERPDTPRLRPGPGVRGSSRHGPPGAWARPTQGWTKHKQARYSPNRVGRGHIPGGQTHPSPPEARFATFATKTRRS